jgi:hypothetical protein
MFDPKKFVKVAELEGAIDALKKPAVVNGIVALDESAKFDPNSIQNNELNVPIGPSEKKLILGEIFEANGGPKERLDGSFTFPYGLQEGKDPLRQALGKYWTPTESGEGAYFLNPFIGDETVAGFEGGAASIPVTIHFSAPELIEGEIWPEYEQELYITPNLQWIYENFAKKYFSDEADVVEEQIKKMLMDGNLSDADIQANIEKYLFEEPNAGNDFSGGVVYKLFQAIQDWWFYVMQVPGSTVKGCSALATAIGSSNADDVCSPWIKLNTPFLDHVLDVPVPIEKRISVAAEPALNVKTPYYSLNSEYNFYIKIYEDLLTQFKNKTASNPLVENVLPNIYPFISSFAPNSLTGEKSDLLKYMALISLNGIVPDEFLKEGLKSSDILEDNNLKKPPASSKQYFSTWSQYLGLNLAAEASKTFDTLDPVKNKYNIMHFPMYHTEILKDYNDDKFMFPMYNELNFSTGVQNTLGDVLRASRLTNGFMHFYTLFADPLFPALSQIDPTNFSFVESFSPNKGFVQAVNTLSVVKEDCQPDAKVVNTKFLSDALIPTTELETFLATLDALELFQASHGKISNLNLSPALFETAAAKFDNDNLQNLFKENTTLITVDENDDYIYLQPGYDMQKNILSVIFVGKLRKMAKEKLRTFTDIMKGEINYSEAVMYIVTKSRWGGTNAEEPIGPSANVGASTSNIASLFGATDSNDGWLPIQTYYFLNTSKENVLKFIDTQVNYDEQYRYDIDAVVLSLGSNYIYKDPESIARNVEKIIEDFRTDGTPVKESFRTNYDEISDYTAKQSSVQSTRGVSQAPPRPPQQKRKTPKTFVPGQPGGSTALKNIATPDPSGKKKGTPITGMPPIPGLTPVTVTKHKRNISALRGAGGDAETDPLHLSFKLSDIFDPESEFDGMFDAYPVPLDGGKINGNMLSCRVTVRKKPSYKLLRVRVATEYGRVLDKPPIFPDVLITPYKGVNDKLLINLNQNVGEYFMKPITFNANEEDQYKKQIDSQKVSLPGTGESCMPEIKYKGDDTIGKDGHFEVYRLNKKPQTYGDFEGRLLTKIRGFHEMEVGHMETDSVSLRDDILPNRKYYYTFRAVDVHGNVSNPTPVFEVEMVDDNGTVYMLQRIIEMAPPDIKDVSKSAKKYIQIKPNFEQSIISMDSKFVGKSESAFNPDTAYGVKLGAMPVSVFGKRYKIRITSKSSGKQIDLNVTFNRTENKKLVESVLDGIYNPELDK